MDNYFLSGNIEELQQAKNAVNEAAKFQNDYDAALAEVAGKEKALESQRRYVTDKVNSAVRERRNQLKKTHDAQVDQANKNLKEAERKRRVAKTDAVQSRITHETADLSDQNAELKSKAKAILKENGMPGFCNTSYYFSMFAPKRGVDFIVFVVTVIIAFGLIPNIVCLCLQTDKLIIKILVYLAVVVFFVGVYFLVFAISKRNKKGPVLEQIRELRNATRENKKQIKRKSKSIEKDTDESSYGLENYDTEIAGFQQALSEAMQNRDAALKVFDEETSIQIRDEIMRENQPTIDKMTEELAQSKQTYEAAQAQLTEANDIVKSYELYLGKKNTSVDKIDGLINLIQEGKATTIMEALDIQNGEIK